MQVWVASQHSVNVIKPTSAEKKKKKKKSHMFALKTSHSWCSTVELLQAVTTVEVGQ